MSKNLVIVESPAKAKTISKFLGRDFTVMASMGHIRDLPKSKMGIDVEHEFEPTYLIPVDKKKVIKELKSKVKDGTIIWIATDEDREGEAIGWHILKALDVEEGDKTKRIVFHEITKPAILEAIKNPRRIDSHLVDAQQARRILDRIVGYELSPLLWRKVRYGLSAGRVQSVAVRFITEREREIEAFKPQESWSLKSLFQTPKPFESLLSKIRDKKAALSKKEEVDHIVKELDGSEWKVKSVEEKEVKRNPSPPFITSTLQQEAARKLGFSVKKTMVLAQQLYEGIEINGESTGLITYMRTDSVNLAETALKTAQEVIREQFGSEYILGTPRYYKSKGRAQEAHEAIRPVDLRLAPKDVKSYLEKDQYRLYELIWMRTLACQMQEAVLNQVGVDIAARKGGAELPYVFRATGQSVKFAGFMKVYTEGKDIEEEELEEGEKFLPKLTEGQSLDFDKLLAEQHFSKPPPRYTEASLVKKLEAEGIGRPSTYAPTISTIILRGYVKKFGKQLKPTDVGILVNDLLVAHFPNIVDYQFTARMEEDLDEIAEGKKAWIPIIRTFYQPFHMDILEKEKTLKKSDITQEKTDEACEKCGKPMIIRLGRYGKFLSCSDYPKCKNAKPLKRKESELAMMPEEEKKASADLEELQKKFSHRKCDKCGAAMQVRNGKFGYFLGCSNYPKCEKIEPIIHFTGVKCPNCETGQLVERRVRRTGKAFYGCNKFPKCKTATWDKPVGNCEKCQGIIVEKKGEKKCLNCG